MNVGNLPLPENKLYQPAENSGFRTTRQVGNFRSFLTHAHNTENWTATTHLALQVRDSVVEVGRLSSEALDPCLPHRIVLELQLNRRNRISLQREILHQHSILWTTTLRRDGNVCWQANGMRERGGRGRTISAPWATASLLSSRALSLSIESPSPLSTRCLRVLASLSWPTRCWITASFRLIRRACSDDRPTVWTNTAWEIPQLVRDCSTKYNKRCLTELDSTGLRSTRARSKQCYT